MKSKNIKVFSMRNDDKSNFLDIYSNKYGVEILGSYFKRDGLFFVFFIIELLRFNKPKAVIFRYLNDHYSILRTVFLAVNIVLTTIICRFFAIKIIWVLHNVDRETHENYPKITKFLRVLLGNMSAKIFVTDPLLLSFASNKYPMWRDKFDFITFGIRDDKFNLKTDDELLTVLKELAQYREAGGYILFCPTAGGDKYNHLTKTPDLMEKARKLGLCYKVVIVGNIKAYLEKNKKLAKELIKDNDVIVIDRYMKYDADEVSGYIDFYWRSLSDQSVSFTLYEAASVEKPIITLEGGFMSSAVKHYKMGVVLSRDLNNLMDQHVFLLNWEKENASNFLASHSWDIAARKLCNVIKD